MLDVRHRLFPLLLAAFLLGCRTVPDFPPVNLSEPGWRVQTGQAVWQPPRRAPEIAGELMLATHADGRALIQFSKSPFPIVIARSSGQRWQIEFAPQERTLRGRGRPPSRFLWFHIAPAREGRPLPAGVHWNASRDAPWRIWNETTGETLEGYLTP